MSVYDQVTAMFIADLEKHQPPWIHPWAIRLPENAISQKASKYIIAESMKFDLESENGQLQRSEAEDHD